MRRSLVLTVLLSLGLAVCGQTANQGGVPTTPPGSATSAATNATTGTARPAATPQPTPQFPAPAELQGTWLAIVDEGDDELTLRLQETGYTITRIVRGFAARGSGRVEVDGDEIVFSRSNLCDGDGRYRWAIEGDVLRFTSIAPDPCPGRAVDGIDFTRDG